MKSKKNKVIEANLSLVIGIVTTVLIIIVSIVTTKALTTKFKGNGSELKSSEELNEFSNNESLKENSSNINNTINNSEVIKNNTSINNVIINSIEEKNTTVSNEIANNVVNNTASVLPNNFSNDNLNTKENDDILNGSEIKKSPEVKSQTSSDATGENSYVSSISITNIITGTSPFNQSETADCQNSDGTVKWKSGNDESENDKIVRSFDKIKYNLDANLAIIEGSTTSSSLKGGTICIKAEFSDQTLENMVKWDMSSMSWATTSTLSDNGLVFEASYEMSKDTINVPAIKNFELSLNTLGISNGKEITPKITMWIKDNDTSLYKTIETETTYASAEPRYNIKLTRNTDFAKRVQVDYGNGNTSGRMYGYGFILQLYNNDASYGLKGIELPKGNISFDINLQMLRKSKTTLNVEDITDDADIVLWNYKVNRNTKSGTIPGRTMYFDSVASNYSFKCLPYGMAFNSDRKWVVFDSGNIEMNQNGNTLNVNVKNYKFDYKFPKYNYNQTIGTDAIYGEDLGIGCFSAGYFQIFVPDKDITSQEDYSYYFNLIDTNFSATSLSNVSTSVQKNTSDDKYQIKYLSRNLSYNHCFRLYSATSNSALYSGQMIGDAKITRQTPFLAIPCIVLNLNNDSDDRLYSIDKLIKFDGDGFEPTKINGTYYSVSEDANTMSFTQWFVTKKDGTNWVSETERNETQIEDLVMYKNYEDIPEGAICIGEYFESTDGYIQTPQKAASLYIELGLQLKSTAKIGRTYGMVQTSRYWHEDLDRTIYSQSIVKGYDSYPTAIFEKLNDNYLKTEYDDVGNIVNGTHTNGYVGGQTILAVAGEQNVTIDAIDSSNNSKNKYDFSKGEYKIKYKISPSVTTDSTIEEPAKGVNEKVRVTLPKGLSYVSDSTNSTYLNTQKIETNEDETTTIEFYLYNISVNDALEDIYFEAAIDPETINETVYDVKAIISEIPSTSTDAEGNITNIYKIGNCLVDTRTAINSVNIVNLASYSLYKTTDTEIVEKNGEIHYKIIYRNNTENDLNDFAILDIMPYNGDSIGTSFKGTFEIEKVKVSQSDLSGVIPNDNINLYYTHDEIVKGLNASNVDANDGLESSSIWTKVSENNGEYILNTEQLNNGVTGIAINGVAKAKDNIIIDIYIKTIGNEALDKYVNYTTGQTYSSTDVMVSTQVKTEVIKREINGIIWYDSNKDSLLDVDEENMTSTNPDFSKRNDILTNTVISLLMKDEKGEYVQAKDLEGNKVEDIKPNNDGTYSFSGLPKGIYKVKVTYPKGYLLVEKEKTSNEIVTSKFNKSSGNSNIVYTDEITKLDTNVNAQIIQNYVNLGLLKGVDFEFTKVAEENHNNALGGAQFKLYKLVCVKHEENYHNDKTIDVENLEGCWELVDTVNSTIDLVVNSNAGKVSFKSLYPQYEYRLVETKAPLNRIKSSGQWKINFDSNNESVITAVENPPAFILEDGGILKVPNRCSVSLPIAGGIGIEKICGIGLVIIIIGLFKTKRIYFCKANIRTAEKSKSRKKQK